MVRKVLGPTTIAAVRCLNCGRVLAEVTQDDETGLFRLCPTHNQSPVQVIVGGRRLLTCKHCGGRAFVEMES
jgi:DNA-directed RNA polymerase subunit RPC12/RpoP